MTRAAASTESIDVGKGALAALVVVGTALALLLIVRARPAPDPFDPRSSSADGATALVELFKRSDAEVTIVRTVPAPGTDTRLLVLADQLDDEQRSATIDFIEAKKLGYNLGNVVKYLTRADHKANKLQDLRKAQWYLEREIFNVENNKKTA